MQLEKAMGGDGETTKVITDQLTRDPAIFGAMCGKTGVFASRADKAQRNLALTNVPALRREIGNYLRVRRELSERKTLELSRERERQSLDVPKLSAAARTVLERVRNAIDH